MNKVAKKIMKFLDNNPQFKGHVVGYKSSRGGIGISRIDNDWYECDSYLLELNDEVLVVLTNQSHE